MVRRKEAQISALVYVAVALILCCFSLPADTVGLYNGVPFWHRLVYPFVHASLLHCVVNCWCLLCIVFLYDIRPAMLIGAYIIAASYPCSFLGFLYTNGMLPTVGASGICYALLGRYSFGVKRKLYYQLWWACFIGIGFFFPNCNAWLHLYCYLCGLVLALLNKPIKV